MKKTLVAAIILIHLFSVPVHSQRTSRNQALLREWPFERLSEFVNDYSARRNGERLVVRAVPMVSKITYEKAYVMYSFKPDENGDVGNTFFTSPSLAKSLRTHLNSAAKSMRITCALIEFVGRFDTYRSPFATKIEGLDASGTTIWTVTGPQPLKLKYRQ